jgi:hypothetical protein
MLPYRLDMIGTPLVAYPATSPPCMPQVAINPLVAPFLAFISATVANVAATESSKNPIRTFYYNELSRQNWNNESFSEAVELTAGICFINIFKKTFISPEASIPIYASNALGYLTSKRIALYPELKQHCSPSMLTDAGNAIINLKNTEGEIAQLNYQFNQSAKNNQNAYINNQHGYLQQQGWPPQGYPQQQGWPPQGYPQQQGWSPQGYPQQQGWSPQGYPQQQGWPPQGYPQQQGWSPQGYPQQQGWSPQGYPQQQGWSQQESYYRQNTNSGSMPNHPSEPMAGQRFQTNNALLSPGLTPGFNPKTVQNNQQNPQINPIQQTSFFKPNKPQDQIFNTIETAVSNSPNIATSTTEVLAINNWLPSEKQWYLSSYDVRTKNEKFIKIGNTVIQIITDKEEPEVDRSQHTIVIGNYEFTRKKIPLKDEESEIVTSFDASKFQPNIKEDAMNEFPEAEVIFDTDVTESFYAEQAEFEAIVEFRGYLSVANIDAYVTHVNVLNPAVTIADYSKVLKSISSKLNFVDAAKQIKQNIISAKDLSERRPENFQNAIEIATLMEKTNIFLTEVINSFLHNNISLSALTIDSFCEDVADLESYLLSKYGATFIEAYRRFERETFNKLLITETPYLDLRNLLFNKNETAESDAAVDPDAEELAKIENIELERNVNTFVTFFPIKHSFVIVNLLSSDLDRWVQREARLIEERECPKLHSVVKQFYENKQNRELSTSYDTLITLDNKKYKIYYGHLGINAYLVSC